MEKLRSIGKKILVPTKALVLFENDDKNKKNALEFCRIEGGVLLDFSPITDIEVRAFVRAAKKVSVDKLHKSNPDLCGPTKMKVVYLSGKHMIFHQPAGEYTLHFGTKGKSEKYWLPPMIFNYKGPQHELDAFMFSGDVDAVLELKEKLIPALLPNISSSGEVCLGNSMAKAKYEANIPNMMKKILASFYNSSFSEFRFEENGPFLSECKEVLSLKTSDKEKTKRVINSEPIKQWLKKARVLTLDELVKKS